MNDMYILNANGEPVPCADALEWARWFEKADRNVARDRMGVAKVSTVFLGVDHGWGDGRVLLYETMVFGGPLDGEQSRYTTRDEALSGHAETVERVRNSLQ